MAKKKVTEKQSVEKPLKKVRSFNLDDKIYNGLMDKLESSGTQVTLSAIVDDFLRKFYVYLIETEGIIEKRKSDIPFSRVIYDSMAIEYFREIKRNTRISNLILSHEAFKEGVSLETYLEHMHPEVLDEMYKE